MSVTNFLLHCIFQISSFKKLLKGPKWTVIAATTGTPLPSLNSLEPLIIKKSGTSVKLSWDHPDDARKETWVYGIYYGITIEETLDSKFLTVLSMLTSYKNNVFGNDVYLYCEN